MEARRQEIVLITGGASGIGAAIARLFLAEGARVCIADRSEKSLAAFAAANTAVAARIESRELDVRDANAVSAWVEDAVARHGRIDWLFNVAGTGVAGEALECTLDDWRYTIEVNLMGVVHGVFAAYPQMVKQRSGNIVNVASMAALMPSPFTVSYATSKSGVVGLSRSLRAEAAHHGVRVMVMCPGVIDTPLLINAGEFGRTTRKLEESTQRDMMNRLMPMNPDTFARRAVAQARSNRAIIVVPRWWKVIWWINRLCVPLADWIGVRSYLEMKKQIEKNAK